MATTNLIVDFLVIGVASVAWIFPILLLKFGVNWISALMNAEAGIIPLMIGLIYIMGIAIDRFSDRITDSLNDKWRDTTFGGYAKPNYHNQLNFIISKSSSAMEYLSYRRSIIRVSRASGVSMLLGALLWGIVGISPPEHFDRSLGIMLAFFCVILGSLLIVNWSVVLKGYFLGIKDIYKVLQKHTGNK